MKNFIKILFSLLFLTILFLSLFWYGIFIPKDINSNEIFIYTAKKGMGDEDIALELEKSNIIISNYFFRFYVVFFGNHGKLKAGTYELSPNMSTKQIVDKIVRGDILKENITIIEGQKLIDIKNQLIEKGVCNEHNFEELVNKDYKLKFNFLEDKPDDINLEGYFFPDTYEILSDESCEIFINRVLNNFNKKFSEDLRMEIIKQKRSVFDIIIIASILEKEVITLNDKKIVAGILNNRLESGMPLQIDATINYITGKSDRRVLISDTKIDSFYNTYKYLGLPKGPISNPGIDSIISAIYPKENSYFYYISTKDGTTIFSKTLEEHNANIQKYLNN